MPSRRAARLRRLAPQGPAVALETPPSATEKGLSEVAQGERGIQVQKHRLCTNEQEMVDKDVEACRKALHKRESWQCVCARRLWESARS